MPWRGWDPLSRALAGSPDPLRPLDPLQQRVHVVALSSLHCSMSFGAARNTCRRQHADDNIISHLLWSNNKTRRWVLNVVATCHDKTQHEKLLRSTWGGAVIPAIWQNTVRKQISAGCDRINQRRPALVSNTTTRQHSFVWKTDSISNVFHTTYRSYLKQANYRLYGISVLFVTL